MNHIKQDVKLYLTSCFIISTKYTGDFSHERFKQ